MSLQKLKASAEWIGCASPDDRIQACEKYVLEGLEYFGCKLGISILKDGGKVIHQEIVVVDKRD